MGQSWVDTARRWAQQFDVRVCNVFYAEEIANKEGMWFCLFKEPHHSMEEIEEAAACLRRDRDVEAIVFMEVEPI